MGMCISRSNQENSPESFIFWLFLLLLCIVICSSYRRCCCCCWCSGGSSRCCCRHGYMLYVSIKHAVIQPIALHLTMMVAGPVRSIRLCSLCGRWWFLGLLCYYGSCCCCCCLSMAKIELFQRPEFLACGRCSIFDGFCSGSSRHWVNIWASGLWYMCCKWSKVRKEKCLLWSILKNKRVRSM